MDWLVAVSGFTRRCLVDFLGVPQERVSVIYHGIDTDHFQPMSDARTRLAAWYDMQSTCHSHDLLYVGNEQPRKNLGVLLSALTKLKSHGYRLRLIKVGGAGGKHWRRQFLNRVHQLELNGDVIVVDAVAEADLPIFYSAADLYVTPSLIEGFGLPVLEAMACGTPVVCSNAGSLPEVVGSAAKLVEPRAPGSLAEAIASVLDDDQLRSRMSERGLVQAAKFTWERTARETVAVYKQVCG